MTNPPPPQDVLWACVEDGFHVGSSAGEFLGYIDRQTDGTYAAFDMQSRPVGIFDELRSAMAAVTNERTAVV